MSIHQARRVIRVLGFASLLVFGGTSAALGDAEDPPYRVARLAVTEGAVSFQPGGTQDWVVAPINRPLTTGDSVWSARDSRAELQLDGSALRLAGETEVSFSNLGNRITQLQLSTGSVIIRVRRLDDDETYEVDTPNLAFSILRPGRYRIAVDESGQTTTISVAHGQGEATGSGYAYPVRPGERDVFSGTERLEQESAPYGGDGDAFGDWSEERDRRWDQSPSARYVSADAVGYEDLDDYGAWTPTPDYGYVWFPRGVRSGWAPYHEGHWAYIAPWGYTWVEDEPWGFTPFHYGRWISMNGNWGWVPCAPRADGAAYVRPVYAPALVAWVGVGAGVAWFALGPREVYVPSYPVSREYVNTINVSNTTVNRTIINNVYNTTIVNNETVNVTNVNYLNRNVRGAIAATTLAAYTSAQPVARNRLAIDPRALAHSPVRAVASPAVPTKQAVLGIGRGTSSAPPAIIQQRTVVARTPPPSPPPTFGRRQDAIRQNGGMPLSIQQARQIEGSVPSAAHVHIAPPATLPIAQPSVPRNATPAVERPLPRSPSPVFHPNEAPPPVKPAPPSAANSALERQHLQEQQALRAQQEEQRQRLQQQQQEEHQRLAAQQAEQARQREVEQQHEQQTRELLQRHAQEEEAIQRQQQLQRQQQENATKAPLHKGVGEH